MKLIDVDQAKSRKRKSKDVLIDALNLSTPVSVSRMSDSVKSMKKILKSGLSDKQKAKLYTQYLNKFLTFKKQKELTEQVQSVKKTTLKKKPKKRVISNQPAAIAISGAPSSRSESTRRKSPKKPRGAASSRNVPEHNYNLSAIVDNLRGIPRENDADSDFDPNEPVPWHPMN